MKRHTRVLGVLLMFACAVGCGQNDLSMSAARMTVTRTSSLLLTPANDSAELLASATSIEPVWRKQIRAAGPLKLSVIGGYVVATGGGGVSVLDVRTGRTRWGRSSGDVSAAALPVLYVSDRRGGVDALNLGDGARRWRATDVCPAIDGAYAVSLISATKNDVFAGCTSGTLFRLNARTGRRLAVWNYESAARFNNIELLSPTTVAVTLVTDGALLVRHLILLRRSNLHQLAADWQEATVLGVVGATAVIDDGCCFGRLDSPVSLFHYDLVDESVSEPHDIPRDADIVLARGSTAAIAGGHLYVSTAPTLDDAGNPLAPSRRPRRLLGDLDEPAMFFVGGRAMVQVNKNKRAEQELLDLQSVPPRVLWRGRREWIADYQERSAADAIVLSDSGPQYERTVFPHLADGRVIAPRDHCGYIAATPQVIVAQCRVGSGFTTIEAFDAGSRAARMHDTHFL